MHLRTVALGGEPIPSWIVNTLDRRRPFPRWRDDKGSDRDHLFRDDNNGCDDNDNSDNDGTFQLLTTYGVTEGCVYLTVGEKFHDNHANDDEVKIISAYSMDESKHIVKRGQDFGHLFPGTTIRICRATTHINDLLRADDKVKESRGDINIDETAILVDSIPELYHVTEDESMTLLLIAVGEVVISGNQVDSMSGYLNLPNETQNSFVKERRPIIVANNGNVIGQRYHYRTGDEGYINPITKNIHILGRMNGMNNNTVKVNGIRIDLSEIENALIDDQNI